MQDEQAHAAEHASWTRSTTSSATSSWAHVPPPGQHVGLGEHLLRQPVLGLLKASRCGPTGRRAAPRGPRDRRVHAVGVEHAHVLLRGLVEVLAPDRHSYRLAHHRIPSRGVLRTGCRCRVSRRCRGRSRARCRRRRPRAGDDDERVLEQDAERDQHDAERRQRVEAGERRGDERAERAARCTSSPNTPLLGRGSNSNAGAVARTARAGGSASSARRGSAAGAAAELEPAPALWQPDLVAPDDELEREQHRDELEHVRRAAGGSGSAGTPSSSTKMIAKLFSSNTSMRPPSVFPAAAPQPALQLAY